MLLEGFKMTLTYISLNIDSLLISSLSYRLNSTTNYELSFNGNGKLRSLNPGMYFKAKLTSPT